MSSARSADTYSSNAKRDRGWAVRYRWKQSAVIGAIGLILLPFNMAHLVPSVYGLWAPTTWVTWFFGVLDLGYGGALVKFIAP